MVEQGTKKNLPSQENVLSPVIFLNKLYLPLWKKCFLEVFEEIALFIYNQNAFLSEVQCSKWLTSTSNTTQLLTVEIGEHNQQIMQITANQIN